MSMLSACVLTCSVGHAGVKALPVPKGAILSADVMTFPNLKPVIHCMPVPIAFCVASV